MAALAIETVADASDAGLHELQWIDSAVEWRARFDQYAGSAQRYEGFRASATADCARALGNNDPELWRMAVAAWAGAPYWRAKSQWRLAESLGALDPDDPEVPSLLAEVEAVAADLRAEPLRTAARATREAASR